MSLSARLRALFFRNPGDLGVRTRRDELRPFVDAVPVTKIAEAKLGERVQVQGTVVALEGGQIVSPIAQRPCVMTTIRRGRGFDTLVVGEPDDLATEFGAGTDFAIDDGSGRVWLHAKDAALLTEPRARYRTWRQYDNTRALAEAISDEQKREAEARAKGAEHERQGVCVEYGVDEEVRGVTDGWGVASEVPGMRRVQYDEHRLDVGQRVRVFCAIDEELGGDVEQGAMSRGYRDLAKRRVARASDDAMWVYLTDE